MFDDSLRRNITFGLKDWDKGVTNERLDEIGGRTACIDKFYDRLTNGYDTEVGENESTPPVESVSEWVSPERYD